MKGRTYPIGPNVIEYDADEVERGIKLVTFASEAKSSESVCFDRSKEAPNTLISQGSGGAI